MRISPGLTRGPEAIVFVQLPRLLPERWCPRPRARRGCRPRRRPPIKARRATPSPPSSAAPPAVAPNRPTAAEAGFHLYQTFFGPFRLGWLIRSPGVRRGASAWPTAPRRLSWRITTGHLVLRLVKNLTMQAVHAFVRIDFAGRVDGLHRAFIGAGLAGVAAFVVAFQPVEHPQPCRDRQRGAQRAQIAAVEPLDEQPRHQQRRHIGHKGPGADEFQHDRGLERLDLGIDARPARSTSATRRTAPGKSCISAATAVHAGPRAGSIAGYAARGRSCWSVPAARQRGRASRNRPHVPRTAAPPRPRTTG